MKSEFVTIVSHQLRTPITPIKGFLDLVLGGHAGPLNDTQRSYLATVQANVDRLTTLVNQLLDLARIEAGKVKANFQPTSMQRAMCEAMATLRQAYDGRGLELRQSIPGDLPEVRADYGLLIQILTNLLSNALKYTLEGSVTVTASVVEGFAQVDIADTGIGMSEQDRAQLFTQFFRSETVEEYAMTEGAGLGLSITRLLVEMHGGRIWVESVEGQGSTFSFTVPLAAI
jgi:signal transduction histidine kinase